MKKRLFSALLGLLLCVGSAVLPAHAQVLGADRVQRFTGAALAAGGGQAALTGASLELYNRLKAEIAAVAGGDRDSSVFEIDTSGMGISYAGRTLHGVDVPAVLRALTVDCPYELYWFDKIKGSSVSYRGSGRDRTVTSITVQFNVSQDYAVADTGKNIYYPLRPDPAKTRAAAAVVQNARALVERSAGLSDYEKLVAYRDYICDQVSYNYAAVGGGNYPYGNPWQLIYVFDNDPGTNVVCEGYAKAFQYLCDLTGFSGAVDCYTVSGRASSDHMWNIVRINGQSYLVDVTNSDTDGVGEFGGLFLAGAPGATGNGCAIHIPSHDLGGGYYVQEQNVNYTYDADTKALYTSDILTLAPSDYDASAASAPPAPEPAPSAFTDVPAWCSAAVDWAVKWSITDGKGGGKFAPGDPCTNAEILTFLWRAAGKPDSDAQAPIPLTGAEWYAGAVRWAAEKGMIGQGFQPGEPCTRVHAVNFIWRAFGSPQDLAAPGGLFADVTPATVPTDQFLSVYWALGLGITNGYGDAFRPGEVCSRGQIVTFLHRAYVPEARLTPAF